MDCQSDIKNNINKLKLKKKTIMNTKDYER